MSTFIMLTYGADTFACSDERSAMRECRQHITQVMCDHYQHKLPLVITPDIIRSFNIRLIKVGPEQGDVTEINLPYQEWADQYYRELRDSLDAVERHEIQRYLELKAKYEGKV